MNNNLSFWESLCENWKTAFINNLPDKDNMFSSRLTYDEAINYLKESGLEISDILSIKKMKVPFKLAYDLSPLFFLNELEEFLILPPFTEGSFPYSNGPPEFVYLYPKALRSKVKKLDLGDTRFYGDFYNLKDFINLETLICQDCHLGSLSGIECLKNLKVLSVDQGNFLTDISPLKGMKLKSLDISWNKVTDLSPLKHVPSIEYLNICYISIDDFSVLLELPNLKEVVASITPETHSYIFKTLLSRNVKIIWH